MKISKTPWKTGKEFGLDGKGLKSVFANDETEGRGPSSVCNASTEDANLIAAAPDLLTALEEILNGLGEARISGYDLSKWPKTLQEARISAHKAIQKANGET